MCTRYALVCIMQWLVFKINVWRSPWADGEAKALGPKGSRPASTSPRPQTLAPWKSWPPKTMEWDCLHVYSNLRLWAPCYRRGVFSVLQYFSLNGLSRGGIRPSSALWVLSAGSQVCRPDHRPCHCLFVFWSPAWCTLSMIDRKSTILRIRSRTAAKKQIKNQMVRHWNVFHQWSEILPRNPLHMR